jgi:hypothetical protein
LTESDHQSVRLGEIAHNIFQASCRGKVRKMKNNSCPADCHLYIVFSTYKDTGIPQKLLADIFPSAAIVDWLPVQRVTGKKQRALVARLKDEYSKDNILIDRGSLIKEIGLRDTSDLKRLLDDQKVQEQLERHQYCR